MLLSLSHYEALSGSEMQPKLWGPKEDVDSQIAIKRNATPLTQFLASQGIFLRPEQFLLLKIEPADEAKKIAIDLSDMKVPKLYILDKSIQEALLSHVVEQGFSLSDLEDDGLISIEEEVHGEQQIIFYLMDKL